MCSEKIILCEVSLKHMKSDWTEHWKSQNIFNWVPQEKKLDLEAW